MLTKQYRFLAILAMAVLVLPACQPASDQSDEPTLTGQAPATTPAPEPAPEPVPPQPMTAEPQAPAELERQQTARAQTPTTPAPAPKPEPKTRPELTSFLDTELVWNGGFETWTAACPDGWECEAADAVQPTDDAVGEGQAAELIEQDDANRWVALNYPIDADDSVLGGTMEVRAQGKADNEKTLFVSIEYTVDGEKQRVKGWHNGGGEWSFVGKKADIPENADPTSLNIRIYRQPGSEGTAIVDHVRAKITK